MVEKSKKVAKKKKKTLLKRNKNMTVQEDVSVTGQQEIVENKKHLFSRNKKHSKQKKIKQEDISKTSQQKIVEEQSSNEKNTPLNQEQKETVQENVSKENQQEIDKEQSAKKKKHFFSRKKKEHKKRKPLTLKATYILCAIVLALSSLSVYYFSDDSKVKILACEGNYYYTDAQIYDLAKVSRSTRLWLVPSSLLESRISKEELIKKVSIQKSEGKMTIKVSEKFPLGYYIEDGQKYILTVDGDSILVEDAYKDNLIHLPLISGFDEEQLQQLCEALQEVKDDLTHDLIEKISEIIPFSSSYDANMIQFVMRDGNSVYSSLNNLSMIVRYSEVLTQLKGASACLVLDAEHLAVDKINCEDITTSRKELQEQKTACEADDDKEWDDETNTCQDIKKKEESEDSTDEDESSQEQSGELISSLQTVDDWEYDEFSGFYISQSAQYYWDPNSNTYYTYDESIGDFRALTNED